MSQQYIVEGNLKHDNASYTTGDKIALEDGDAQPLLAIGRVKLSEAPKAEQKPADEAPLPPTQPQQAAPAAPQVQQVQAEQKPASTPKQPTAEEIAKTVAQVE